jgi:hypothetical protein
MLQMEIIDDPAEIARGRERRASFQRNWNWFKDHSAEIHGKYRGKCLCISGEEVFVADTPEGALSQAQAAHPDDIGRFMFYIPRDKVARVYAN